MEFVKKHLKALVKFASAFFIKQHSRFNYALRSLKVTSLL
jgi:hypothetical protein